MFDHICNDDLTSNQHFNSNPLTAGPDVFSFFEHQILNMVKIKRGINKKDGKIEYLPFVKSE